MRLIAFLLLLTCTALASAPLNAAAQETAPLQVNARVWVGSNDMGASFERRIRPGDAMMSARVRNLPSGETALVSLHFNYKINADFALDEIISLIVISIEDRAGHEFSRSTIDPNEINLNPNRAALDYSATLYTANVPHPESGYVVHVRVFGNYE